MDKRILRGILALVLAAATLVGAFAGVNFLDDVVKMDDLRMENNVSGTGDFSQSYDFKDLMDGYLQLLELSFTIKAKGQEGETYTRKAEPYTGKIEELPFLKNEKGDVLTLGEVSRLGGHGYDYEAYLSNYLQDFEKYSEQGISLQKLTQRFLDVSAVLVEKDGELYWMSDGETRGGLSEEEYKKAEKSAKQIPQAKRYASKDMVLPSFGEGEIRGSVQKMKVLLQESEQKVELSSDYQKWISEAYPEYAGSKMKKMMAEACENDFKGTAADGTEYSVFREPVLKDYRKAHRVGEMWEMETYGMQDEDEDGNAVIVLEDYKGRRRQYRFQDKLYINHGKTEVSVGDFQEDPDKYYQMAEDSDFPGDEDVYDISIKEYAASLKEQAEQVLDKLEKSAHKDKSPWSPEVPLCNMDMMADIAQFYICFSKGLDSFLDASSFVYTVQNADFEVSSDNKYWREFCRRESEQEWEVSEESDDSPEESPKGQEDSGIKERILYASYDKNGAVYLTNMFWEGFENSGSLSKYLENLAAPYQNAFCAVGVDLGQDSLTGKNNVMGNVMRTYQANQKEYRERKEKCIVSLCWLGGAALIMLLCFLFLAVMTGQGKQSRLALLVDRIYIELLLIAAFLCIGLALDEGWYFYSYGIEQLQWTPVSIQLLYPVTLAVFVLAVCAILLSLIRRAKRKEILKSSLVFRGVRLLFRNMKKGGRSLRAFLGRYHNQKAFVRYAAAGGIWLFLWIVLGVLFFGSVYGDGVLFLVGMTGGILLFIVTARLFVQGFCNAVADEKIVQGASRIAEGDFSCRISTEGRRESKEQRELTELLNHIGEALERAVEESVRSERMKTELITNVSHDIKTPLTSVINYIDLLKREEMDNARAREYLEVLDKKSQRLKVLIEDLVEASKASSGAIELQITELNFNELIHQTDGEFEEKFEAAGLVLLSDIPKEAICFRGDGRRVYRILENLYGNVAKYAMPGTRVYTSLCQKKDSETGKSYAEFSVKNISREPLNVTGEELTERFVRGDASRATEGSGLGLSITKSLTELMNGTFEIYLDGDLFRVTLAFPLIS